MLRHLVRRVGGWDVSMPFPRYTLSTYHKDDILSAIIPASRVDKYLWQIASQNIHCLHARNRLQVKVKSADGVGRQINVLIWMILPSFTITLDSKNRVCSGRITLYPNDKISFRGGPHLSLQCIKNISQKINQKCACLLLLFAGMKCLKEIY